MMRSARLALLALFALCAFACGTQTPPAQPGSFERPSDVAFACFETAGTGSPRVMPLASCAVPPGQTTPPANMALHALVTQTARGEVAAVDLTAGRIIDSRPDIPGYTFIPVGEIPSAIVVPREHPQVTYVASSGSREITVLRTLAFRQLLVGDDPTLQVVKVRLPSAGPGSAALSPSAMVLSPDEDALFVVAPDAGVLLRMPIRRCAAGSIADAGVSDSDAGVSCADGTIDEGGIQQIPLADSLAKAVTTTAKGVDDEPYGKRCDESILLPPPAAVAITIPVSAFGQSPQPIALAIDAYCKNGEACQRRLLVADRALPIIHVVDIDKLVADGPAASVMAPIVTGVPTLAVSVTPRVPVSLDAAAGETQYVYAIDATDGSVLVTENGRVLSVNSDPGARPDRIDLGEPFSTGQPQATAMAVLYPEFDVTAGAAQFAYLDEAALAEAASAGSIVASFALVCAGGDPSATSYTQRDTRYLRGVFLAVGVSDGSVRIVDIHDVDLKSCETCPYPVVRHRTRIQALLSTTTAATPITPSAGAVAPTFIIGTTAFGVRTDGTVDTPEVDGLACIPCQSPMFPAFPSADAIAALGDGGVPAPSNLDAGRDAGTPGADAAVSGTVNVGQLCPGTDSRVCGLADPWATVGRWSARFEGSIPDAHGGRGRFVEPGSADSKSGQLELAGEVDFCKAGVQGNQDLQLHAGDQVVITAAAPANAAIAPAYQEDCQKLFDARTATNSEFVIAFPIEQAFSDRLVIGDKMIRPPSNLPAARRDYSFVQECFRGMLMTFDVRTRDGYTVIGRSGIGFQHRVVKDATTGRCVVDDKQSATRTGRAYPDEVFQNRSVAFRIAAHHDARGLPIRPELGAQLYIGFAPSAPKLVLDANAVSTAQYNGVLPVALRYSDTDERLYMVDISLRGLVPIPLSAFPVSVGGSYQ